MLIRKVILVRGPGSSTSPVLSSISRRSPPRYRGFESWLCSAGLDPDRACPDAKPERASRFLPPKSPTAGAHFSERRGAKRRLGGTGRGYPRPQKPIGPLSASAKPARWPPVGCDGKGQACLSRPCHTSAVRCRRPIRRGPQGHLIDRTHVSLTLTHIHDSYQPWKAAP